MALIVDPELALGVLETLARFQGADVDERTEEEPGRILHEMRFGAAGLVGWPAPTRSTTGSVDATPLFVMLLGELRRWGLAHEVVDRRCCRTPTVPSSGSTTYGDRDGDGYVEYQRATDRGRANQGWKDSWDAGPLRRRRLARRPSPWPRSRATSTPLPGPGPLRRRGRRRRRPGAGGGSGPALKEAFNRDFWLADAGWFGAGPRRRQAADRRAGVEHGPLPLDRHGRRGQGGRGGQAPPVRRCSVGWGVRTLASSMGGYDPVSYHTGSVWPHDNALIAAGLMRYGFVDEATGHRAGQLDAAAVAGGRLLRGAVRVRLEDVGSPVRFPDDRTSGTGRRRRRCRTCGRCCGSTPTCRRGSCGCPRRRRRPSAGCGSSGSRSWAEGVGHSSSGTGSGGRRIPAGRRAGGRAAAPPGRRRPNRPHSWSRVFLPGAEAGGRAARAAPAPSPDGNSRNV